MANEKRLIDYEVARNATYEEVFWTESEQASVRNFLAKLPKVDAVEVVRCKDCKHREKSPWHDGYRCGNPYDGMASGVELRDDDFCSYGERREGE